MRGAAADLMMYQGQPIPMGYMHLLEVMIFCCVCISSVALVTKLHWVAPVVNLVVTFFFYGFYLVPLHMIDPFDELSYFGFDVDRFYDGITDGIVTIDALVPSTD